MFSRIAPAAAVLALATSAAAQTFSACNPTKVDPSTCPINEAFGSDEVTIDFTKGKSDLFTASTGGTPVTYDPSLGAVFTIAKEGEAPTFTSNKYLFFGRVDVTMRVSPGAGIVTTFVLESDDLDEVDWEWLGGEAGVGQANYFSKGDTATYGTLEQDIAVPGGDGAGTFHTYSLDWTAERLEWLVDGVAYRTLTYAENPDMYPQTPMQVKFGTWCGGCSSAEGTRAWAGGAPDWSAAPFKAYYKSIVVNDASNGVANAVSYSYGDQSGSYKSIVVHTGSKTTESGSTGNDSSADGSSSASSSHAGSSTQGASTTLTTATASAAGNGSGSATATATATAAEGTAAGAANGTAAATGSASQSSSPVTAGAQQSAVNFALLGAALLAFVSL